MALCTSCTSASIPYLPLKTATISPAQLIEQDETAEGADGPAATATDELDLSETTEEAWGGGGGAGKAEGGGGGAGKLDLYV